jgi:hypothetical protein
MEHALVEYDDESYLLSGHDGAGNPVVPPLKYSAGVWTPLAPEPTPEIRAAGDACFGRSGAGDPVIVLFPEPEYGPLTDTLHVYDIASDSWGTLPMPAPLPSGGLWGLSIVSDRENNVCYLSGGRDTSGVVQNTLYAYDVDANTAASLPSMTTARFHHASWLYDDMVCVAGGATPSLVAMGSTQCYDVDGGTWLGENVPLGALPYPTMAMADVEKWVDRVQQLWIAGGTQSSVSAPHANTAYWDSDAGTWTLDTPLPHPVMFGAGHTLMGQVYVAGGSGAASTPVVTHQQHVQCGEEPRGPTIYLPVVFKNHCPDCVTYLPVLLRDYQ